MIKKLSNSNQSSSEMTGNQSDIYLVEAFLEENFLFRRNLLSGKTEFAVVSEDNDQALTWNVFTKEDLNTIVRKAKKLGLGGNGSPRQDIEEYIGSNHNLFVNIDELANMGPSQQGKLKQTLSKVKVNGRPTLARAKLTVLVTPRSWRLPTMSIRFATLREVADSSASAYLQVLT